MLCGEHGGGKGGCGWGLGGFGIGWVDGSGGRGGVRGRSVMVEFGGIGGAVVGRSVESYHAVSVAKSCLCCFLRACSSWGRMMMVAVGESHVLAVLLVHPVACSWGGQVPRACAMRKAS